VGIKMPFNVEVYDTTPPNGYNTATFEFTNKYSGNYSLVSNLKLDLKNNSVVNQNFFVNAHININGNKSSNH
jgi:hypothetical protein